MQVPRSNLVQRRHLLSRSPHQDCLINGRLNRIWQCKTDRFANKFKLYKSLVTSIFLYGCETWTLLADSEKKDPGFRNQVHEETSSHLPPRAQDNDGVRSKMNFRVGS